MFERFDSNARRVTVKAQEAARTQNQPEIGAECLLIGLLDSSSGAGVQVLLQHGISPPKLRKELIGLLAECSQPSPPSIPFSQASQSVLEHSLGESLALGHWHIGTGHILLGLLGPEGGAAAATLAKYGLRLDRGREGVKRLLEEVPNAEGVRSAAESLPIGIESVFRKHNRTSNLAEQARGTIWAAFRVCMNMRDLEISVSHLLSGLWDVEKNTPATRWMEFYGLTKSDMLPTITESSQTELVPTGISPGLKTVFEQSIQIADDLGSSAITTEILLAAASRSKEGKSTLQRFGIRPLDVDMISLERLVSETGAVTSSAARTLKHAAFLAKRTGIPRMEISSLLTAILLIPDSEHPRSTQVLARFGFTPREILDELFTFQDSYEDLQFDLLELEMRDVTVPVSGEILEVVEAARTCTGRTGDTAVDTVHLFVGIIEVSQSQMEDSYQNKPGSSFASELEEFALTPDSIIATASAVRYRTGDADRSLNTEVGISSERRGSAPQPTPQYGFSEPTPMDGASKTPLKRLTRRTQRPRMTSGADSNSPWHDFSSGRWAKMYNLRNLAALILVVASINAIAGQAPWWIIFGVILGTGHITLFRGWTLALLGVVQGTAITVFWMGDVPWLIALTAPMSILNSYMKFTEINWRKRDVGDPTYDINRQSQEMFVAWTYAAKRGRGVR